MELWREIVLIVVLCLSAVDLALTYTYVKKYKKWQPHKPYRMMESNPLLVLCWDNLGLKSGGAIADIIILTINALIVIYLHWAVSIILFILLIITFMAHRKNFKLLNKLIKKYPSGHLPEKTFGKVEGNNKIKKEE